MGTRSNVREFFRRYAAAGSILLSLVCVVALGLWGAYRDLDQVHQTIWSAEVSRVRSHAERTVGHLESEIVDRKLSQKLSELQTDLWLRFHWQRSMSRSPDRIYSAITDADGEVLLHSDRSFENRTMIWPTVETNNNWTKLGVTKIAPNPLTHHRVAWDVSVPILMAGSTIGFYHVGLDAKWLNDRILESSTSVIWRWLFVIGSIVVVVTVASFSLYSITKRNAELRDSLGLSEIRRAREMSQVMSGLAHEIRNPLNAIRLNLHALERVFRNDSWMATEELKEMLGESIVEINRIANLITEISQFSKRDPTESTIIDIVDDVRRTLTFVGCELEDARIDLRSSFEVENAFIQMNSDRLRQILLNLLRNGAEAAGPGGWISVDITSQDGGYMITVEDSGPGVPTSDRELVFEPFYSTKSTGMGLGLSMARKYAMESSGKLECQSKRNQGTHFVLWFPQTILAPAEGMA